RYETVDDFGARYTTWKDLVVAPDDERAGLGLPLVVLSESSSVKVGERARLLISTGLAGQPIYFERYRAGKRIERRRLGEGAPALVEIPVEEADRGGFGVSILMLRDHQVLRAEQSIFVPWDDRELGLSFSTFRDKLRPGTQEIFRITVKSPSGKPVEAGAA